MPKSNPTLINALRVTAQRLQAGVRYEWGHMARCNCGHLVQTITGMTDSEIARSVDYQLDEWTEYVNDYCEGSSHKVEDLFVILQDVGFSPADVMHLENLSDKQVLRHLEQSPRYLRRNCREDVTLYLTTMADMLEQESGW
jgi:hypothetical protein